MSGIAGIYHLDGKPVGHLELGGMIGSLAHRGPDKSDVWHTGPIGLGHQMLFTTPESLLERQPVVDRSGTLVLTADARVDNREELLSALRLRERPSREVTDATIILSAYERWGEQSPQHIIGDFAFAIWDQRRRHVFCARDAVGVKPIYYHYLPGRVFAFASEIKALLHLPQVPRQINDTKIVDYLASQAEDKAITFFEGIFRLPPAHSLTVTSERLSIREYWDLDPQREIKLGSPDEYAEAFREVFIEAVRCRLRSAYPVGLTLSGGLDSSSIVGVAKSLRNEMDPVPIHTISCVFDDVLTSDEREYMGLMVPCEGIQSHFVHPDRRSALDRIDEILWHQDQPIYVRNYFLWTTMYDKAREEGVRVMLDGEDGDTVVSKGYQYLYFLARAGKWNTFADLTESPALTYYSCHEVPRGYWLWRYGLPQVRGLARENRWLEFARAVDHISKRFNFTRRQLILDYGVRPRTPDFLRRTWRSLRRRSALVTREQPSGGRLVNPAVAQRVGYDERSSRLMARYSSPSSYREGHYQALTAGTASSVMEEDDKTSAAFGIEKRHPYFDRRLMEFCLAIPVDLRLHEGWPRWIQRRAMDGILPEEIRWRIDKADLGHNFERSFLEFERERIESVLNDPGALSRYVDMSNLTSAYNRRDATTVWAAVVLSAWLEHMDQVRHHLVEATQ